MVASARVAVDLASPASINVPTQLSMSLAVIEATCRRANLGAMWFRQMAMSVSSVRRFTADLEASQSSATSCNGTRPRRGSLPISMSKMLGLILFPSHSVGSSCERLPCYLAALGLDSRAVASFPTLHTLFRDVRRGVLSALWRGRERGRTSANDGK